MPAIAVIAATLSLAAAPQAAPAPAFSAAETADLQCLAVSMVIGGMSEDETVKTGLMAASMFYLGRLEGRTPNVVWLDRLGDYLRTATPEQMQAQTQRCGTEIAEMGDRVQTWSSRIAAETGQAPNPPAD
jgi:hypothetical protein